MSDLTFTDDDALAMVLGRLSDHGPLNYHETIKPLHHDLTIQGRGGLARARVVTAMHRAVREGYAARPFAGCYRITVKGVSWMESRR